MQPASAPPQHQHQHCRSGKRSVTGCRTCRARHIKCDEAPDACHNCSSTGRKCDGYDLYRLPLKKRSAGARLSDLSPQLGWVPTSDERRCFSYFQHHSVPSLAGFFDSQLWQQVALQMSRADPAVYHAANALSALHEDSETTKLMLVGEHLNRPLHRFALEQATRSFALLNRRGMSQDPERAEVVLLCCLLFVLMELLLGRYDNALQHLRSGLRILKETQQGPTPRIARCILEAFQRLDVQSSHFGLGRPSLFEDEDLNRVGDEDRCAPLHNLEEAHRRVNRLLNAGVAFLAQRWLLSNSEIRARYGELCQRQQRILSLYRRFQEQFKVFYAETYAHLRYKEQRGADTIRLQYLSQLVAVKNCLLEGPVPEILAPEYADLLSAHEAFITKFPERPTMTLDFAIIPGLHTIAVMSPRYSMRIRAIQALLSWPHHEGIVSSIFAASVAVVSLKAELTSKDQREIAQLLDGMDGELPRFLSDTMMATHNVSDWTSVRASKLLEQQVRPEARPDR